SGGESVEEFIAHQPAGGENTYAPLPPLAPPGSGPEAYLRRMGLLRLEHFDGLFAPAPTPASDAFRDLAGAG
ncbi:MAG TPA: hypothetical protein VGK17_01020, partial [Propionicimonas sp.]